VARPKGLISDDDGGPYGGGSGSIAQGDELWLVVLLVE